MPAINANIVVDSTNLTVTPTTNNIGVTLDPVQLNVYTGAFAPAGGASGQIQYNNNSRLEGIANTNVANGNIAFGNVANIKIDGGTNAYYLQTDGTGNLTWAAGGTPTGNGTPSGANTQIQLSDGSGAFSSGAGFTFDNVSNVFSVPGQSIFVGNVDCTSGIFNGDGGGLSNVSTQKIENGTSNVDIPITDGDVVFGVGGTANVVNFSTGGANVNGNLNVTNDITSVSGIFTGDGGGLSNVQASNVTGVFGNIEISGTTTIQQVKEKVKTDATPATGTINYDLLDQAIILNTANATANFTLNFRGNSTVTLDSLMSSNQSITCSFINPNGTNPYYANIIQIDGTPVTTKWSSLIGGSSNGSDLYTFNIIKTASATFSVFVSNQGYS